MRIRALLILILAALAGAGCSMGGVQPPTTLQPTLIVLPSLTPAPGVSPAVTASATVFVTPTAAPPLEGVWPLPADLFYLTDSGQVWRQPAQGDESAALQVSRQGDVVSDFAVAPGGQYLLLRVGGAVSVMALDGSGSRVIAQDAGAPPDAGQGHTLAWSDDAAHIAYVTAAGFQVYIPGGASSAEPSIFAVPSPDSPIVDVAWSPDSRWLLARRADGGAFLADTADLKTLRLSDLGKVNGDAWLSDSRLLFAPVEGGLALVDPGLLDTRTFLIDQTRQVDLPVQQPDGPVAFFVHTGGLGRPGELYSGLVADQTFQPVTGAGIATTGLSWSQDAARLIGPGDGSALRLIDPATGSEGRIGTQGSPVNLSWGEPPLRGVTSLPLPANLYFLAPQTGITQVWRLPSNGDPPEPITSAPVDVTAYDISFDGTQVAYTSNGTIYRTAIGSQDVQEIAQLAEGAHSPTGTPAFSPTGKRIAFASNGIWIYDEARKDVGRMLVDIAPPAHPDNKTQIFDHPRWSPDGLWLLLRVTYFQGQDHALIPSGGGFDPLPFGQFNAQAKWGADGAVYVFSDGTSAGEPSLTRISPARPPITKKLSSAPVLDVQTRPDGRLSILRSPSPFPFGPTSTRIFSIQPDGGDVRAETPSLVLEKPLLSPDSLLVAGLAFVQRGADGTVSGQLVIVNPATKDMFVLDGVPSVHDLMWGR